MKRTNTILTAGLALLAICSCRNNVEIQEDTTVIEIVKSELEIPAKGGVATIEINASGPVKLKFDDSWLSAEISGKLISFTAEENMSLLSRYAKVKISCDGETTSAVIQQYGYKSSGFDPSASGQSTMLGSEAGVLNFDYDYDEPMKASSDVDWIAVEISESTLTLNISENNTAARRGALRRIGHVSWSLGPDKGVIEISQMNVNDNFMRQDSNWAVKYEGVQSYQGSNLSVISNTVANPSISGKYLLYYVTKEETAGQDMGDFLFNYSSVIKEELDAAIEYYGQSGMTLSYDDFLLEDSGQSFFNPITTAGEYYAIAIGFDSMMDPSGNYAYNSFTVNGSSSGSGYEAWLGEWTCNNNGTPNTWTISQDVKNESYIIIGIAGQNYPVTALFDSASDELVVRCQVDLGIFNSEKYGECSVGLYGTWTNENGGSSLAVPNDPSNGYPIFTASLTADGATISPCEKNVSGQTGYYEAAKFIGKNSEGKYVSIVGQSLPSTLSREGSGGEGNGSEAYKKWLGSYNVAIQDYSFTVVVSENVADESFKFDLSNLYGEGVNLIIDYDKDSDAASLKTQTVRQYTHSTYGQITDTVYGWITESGDIYYVGGSYSICRLVKSGDKITFQDGATLELTDGSRITLEGFNLYGICSQGALAYMEEEYYPKFPLVLSKASTSSVKQTSSRTGNDTALRLEKGKSVVESEEIIEDCFVVGCDDKPALVFKRINQ